MGMCKLSGGIEKIYGPYKHSLPQKGKSNSRRDYYDEKTGKLLQQRWYDSEGKAILDRDWDHGNKHTHTFPHDHFWVWENDNIHPSRIAYVGPNGEKINNNYL